MGPFGDRPERGSASDLLLAKALETTEAFEDRHIGPDTVAIEKMCAAVGAKSLDEFVASAIPAPLRSMKALALLPPATEGQALEELRSYAEENRVLRSYLGQGYSDCIVPAVIRRNVFENPGWYTQYTPYQAEIAQGRLEALLNFQTMVSDLVGLPLSNASLLDEGTAAAEAMTLLYGAMGGPERKRCYAADDLHPQTLAVVQQRAIPLGIDLVVGPRASFVFDANVFGAIVATPTTHGTIVDVEPLCKAAHAAGAGVAAATDLLACCLMRPPGEQGADVVFGSAQRFGVPMGFGGPHAAFFATKTEHQRRIPGRLAGLSKDRHGNPAARLTLQTREQHIRRDKATSNICTAQVLLAVMAGMYAVYHGPKGLSRIARRVHAHAVWFAEALRKKGFQLRIGSFFDTVVVESGPKKLADVAKAAEDSGRNLRRFADGTLGLTFDETTDEKELTALLRCFGIEDLAKPTTLASPLTPEVVRTTPFLTHPVFHQHHSETAMQRYLRSLEAKDLSLTHSMIPLGSCTMKLNAAAEMLPLGWTKFARMHPFAPEEQTKGYRRVFADLERWLGEITGFPAVSLQPNSGAQGEYAGMLAIRGYHHARGEMQRDVCLIPTSAHGTNPASAAMAGFRVVAVACDVKGNVDMVDLKKKIAAHEGRVAACLITYPSTHGVYEATIKELCALVHAAGGQVYMDGANMNALVGHCRPAELGADVCHLNLHKTFCIPHGGGGPGVGPIGVAAHLEPYLPGHPVVAPHGAGKGMSGPVASAPWGSAFILVIPWMYIRMMGGPGLTKATSVAVLAANYVAKRLEKAYPVLFTGANGRVAHECILDLRPFKKTADVEVEDVAKRLIDYGFHAPTMSWPVPGTLMVEPTESEPLEELERFCDAMLSIRAEIADIEAGRLDRAANPLKNAPHTMADVQHWQLPYPAALGAFPAGTKNKFWPAVSRVDNVYGDRNLFCTCAPVEAE